MNRENILFAAVGLLLGYVVAFHLVVHVNQGQAAQAVPAGGAAAAGAAADQPPAAGDDAQERQRLRAAADEAARAARENPEDFAAQTRAAAA